MKIYNNMNITYSAIEHNSRKNTKQNVPVDLEKKMTQYTDTVSISKTGQESFRHLSSVSSMVEKYEAKSDAYIEKNVKNQKVDSTFSYLKTESKSAFIESLKAFQAQNPNFLSNVVNKELSRRYI